MLDFSELAGWGLLSVLCPAQQPLSIALKYHFDVPVGSKQAINHADGRDK